MKKNIKLMISGITCSSCVKVIESGLKDIKGIFNSKVNLIDGSSFIAYDDEIIKIDEIISEIGKLGYKVEDLNAEDIFKKEVNLWKNKLLLLLFFILPLLLLMPFDFFKILPELKEVIMPYHPFLGFVASTLSIIFIGFYFFKSGFGPFLKGKKSNMYTLISIGIISAYLLSIYNYFTYIYEFSNLFVFNEKYFSGVYFEVAAFILFFVTFGKYLEIKAKGKTGESIKKLLDLIPKEVTIVKNGEYKIINTDLLKNGDIVLIKPGEKIPADGKIISGNSSINESVLTGESIPVEKNKDSKIFAGTINSFGSFEFVVEKIGEQTSLYEIANLLKNATQEKTNIEQITDKISSIFVPIIIILALVTFVVHFFVLKNNFESSLIYFISVVVIACPCALGLATPTAVTVGVGRASSSGILIKGGLEIEKAKNIDTIIFDKTGTITNGTPEVIDIISMEPTKFSREYIINIVASLEQKSEHPIAKSIVKYANDIGLKLFNISDFNSLTGLGIEGNISGVKYIFGSKKLFEETDYINVTDYKTNIYNLESQGKTAMLLVSNNVVIGIITVADKIKENSIDSIKKLQNLGKTIYMLTGDNELVASKIAESVGIKDFVANLKPSGKMEIIKKLQKEGKKVMMVGDGINDAPALKESDLGISMGGGVDVTKESAGVIILKNDLGDLVKFFKYSHNIYLKIIQNLFLSFIYNLLTIPVAAGVFVSFGLYLKPEFASLAMALSSVSVIGNSLLLRK